MMKDVVINIIIDPESVERMDRLCDRLDTFRSDVVEIALEVFERALDAGAVTLNRKSNLCREENDIYAL